MNSNDRDLKRHKLIVECNAQKAAFPPCAPAEKAFFDDLFDSAAYKHAGKNLADALALAELSFEEAIVAGVVALVRSSKLPHHAVLEAVSECLNRENNAHKNRTSDQLLS